jgi:hypothetical protein
MDAAAHDEEEWLKLRGRSQTLRFYGRSRCQADIAVAAVDMAVGRIRSADDCGATAGVAPTATLANCIFEGANSG